MCKTHKIKTTIHKKNINVKNSSVNCSKIILGTRVENSVVNHAHRHHQELKEQGVERNEYRNAQASKWQTSVLPKYFGRYLLKLSRSIAPEPTVNQTTASRDIWLKIIFTNTNLKLSEQINTHSSRYRDRQGYRATQGILADVDKWFLR